MEQPKKQLSLKEKVDFLYNVFNKTDKKGQLKLPRRAKVSKSRMKKGYCGVLFLNENRVITGQKVRIEGGTYRTKDGYIHVTNGKELLFWNGKHPILFQRYDKLNPTNLLIKEGEKNEIYGQDLVKLRYKRDLIKEKKSGGMSIVMILVLLAIGYVVLKALFPNMFGA